MFARFVYEYSVYAGMALCLLLAFLLAAYRFLRLLDKGYRRSTVFVLSVIPAAACALVFLLVHRADDYRIDYYAYGFAVQMMLLWPFITWGLGALFVPRVPRRTGPNFASHFSRPFGRFCWHLSLTVGMILISSAVLGFWLLPGWYWAAGAMGFWCSFMSVSVFFEQRVERERVPTYVEEHIAGDNRRGVLYIRTFAQEGDHFVWARRGVLEKRIQNFKAPDFGFCYATFEQFLSFVFVRDFGPFVALGSPSDEAPPNGAVRGYYHDTDWENTFLKWAEWARVIVMQTSCSRALTTELVHIARNGWHTKSFVLTPPAPWTRDPLALAMVALMRVICRIPRTKWHEFVNNLGATQLVLPQARPAAGSILTFDKSGGSVTLASGIVTPEEVTSVIRARLTTLETVKP